MPRGILIPQSLETSFLSTLAIHHESEATEEPIPACVVTTSVQHPAVPGTFMRIEEINIAVSYTRAEKNGVST